jgi:hypothetical protein
MGKPLGAIVGPAGGGGAWAGGRCSSAWPLGRAIRPTARSRARTLRAGSTPSSYHVGSAGAGAERVALGNGPRATRMPLDGSLSNLLPIACSIEVV